jgi:hypothetical protein
MATEESAILIMPLQNDGQHRHICLFNIDVLTQQAAIEIMSKVNVAAAAKASAR